MSDHTLLLLHGESLEDSSIYNVPLSGTGVTVSSNKSKFGGKSLYFNGNGELRSKNFNLKSHDFTFDWWEYIPSDANYSNWRCPFAASSGPDFVWAYNNSGIALYMQPSYSGTLIGKHKRDIWVHRAFVRHGDMLYAYENGTKVWSGGYSGDVPMVSPSYEFRVGGRISPSQGFLGYIDEFRISDIARWTSNFTPPDKPYVITEPQKENSVMIGGTIYKIEGGNAMVNGAIHKIESGNVLIAGTVRKIEFPKPLFIKIVKPLNSKTYVEFSGKKYSDKGVYVAGSGTEITAYVSDAYNSKGEILFNDRRVAWNPGGQAKYTWVLNKSVEIYPQPVGYSINIIEV